MIKYIKINGNGNNFLILDNLGGKYDDEQLKSMAIKDCNVKTSIGADGILVVEKSNIADIKMRLINSNGLEGEMCGNGARCMARYAYDKNIAPKKMSIETLAGIMKAEVFNDVVKLDLGLISISNIIQDATVMYDGRKIIYNYLTVCVPHIVIYIQENGIDSLRDMKKIGEYLDKNRDIFHEGVNSNFVNVIDSETIEVITYERGVDDFTDSCGTGSCASAIVSALKFGIRTPIIVKNPGGINKVYFNLNQNNNTCQLELEGNAVYCAEVNIIDSESLI